MALLPQATKSEMKSVQAFNLFEHAGPDSAHSMHINDIDCHCNVLCREEDSPEVHGHITSLAVARTHRKLGMATMLMSAARAL